MKRMLRLRRHCAFMALMTLVVTVVAGCGRSGLRIAWGEFTRLNSKRCTYAYFSGREYMKIDVDAGEEIAIDYDVEVDKGSLGIRVEDPDGDEVWTAEMKEENEGTFDFTAEKAGNYTVVVVGDATKGSFEIDW